MSWIDSLLEKNLLPDWAIRRGIKYFLVERLRQQYRGDNELQQTLLMNAIQELKESPIAIKTESANEQHYEVDTELYKLFLGKRLKYSSAYWATNITDLNTAEETMLDLTCKRAQIENGQSILELGCGWGSLSLWLAEKYPDCQITGISNSKTQKQYIDLEIKKLGLHNLTIITCDINNFEIESKFDRVISIEMFEHMKNYERLMAKIGNWLKSNGLLFVHIFTHKDLLYHFTVEDDTNWMSKYFFTGGTMPSKDLLLYFQEKLKIQNQWVVNGHHYSKTLEFWLQNLYKNKESVLKVLSNIYGEDQARKWWVYWRVFLLSCSESFKFNNGNEWFVSHYLFKNLS